ncbi:MAG: AraC family transcriptional regulator [Ruminococcus sp.]|nr:AraC family transcriptional regulator [Ruminococcus sp.]
MRMDDVGYNHKHDSSFVNDRPEGAGDWLLLAVKTRSVFRIDGKEVHAPANSFIIFTPEYPEYYRGDDGEYIDDWMHFGPDKDEEALMHELGIPFNRIIPLSDIKQVSLLIRNICYEHYSANRNRSRSVDLYFRLLLYKLNECMDDYSSAGSVNESKYFEKMMWLRESIYRWPAKEWSIDDMAAEISLSRSRLQHLYSDTFGVSISKDLITSRMEKAKDYLKTPELSVSEIAALVGYGTPSYFNRQFKSTFGETPLQYREKYLNSTDLTIQERKNKHTQK